MSKMTASEFEKSYAVKRYGMDVETFRSLGFRIMPCNCGNDDCTGWRPSHPGADRADALADISHSLNHVVGFIQIAGQFLARGPLGQGFMDAMRKAAESQKVQ